VAGPAHGGHDACVSDSLRVLDEQVAYYRAIADEYDYDDVALTGWAELLLAIDAFRPAGDVLELACGSGVWTERLVRSARTVTACDAAPEMLARARARTAVGSVFFIEADLFSWQPRRRYDAVFFGFWLSHVPEEQFASFWSLVDQCLRPGGEVFFFDDNYRAEDELIEGTTSEIVERRSGDGTPFRIVKVPYRADDLERRLRELGWNIAVKSTTGPFYWGVGGR
jgi:SAM-dependent methyltransferase